MFIRPSAILLSVAALAVAAPGALEARNTDQCNTGSIQCCNSAQSSTSTLVTELAGLLGVSLAGVTGQVGVACTPVTVVGTGSGSTCTQQPVCCTGNSFSGLIVIGCSPINLNL